MLRPEVADQNVKKAVMREAVAIQMTWPGAPTLYYGDEAGLCGFTDPDNRRAYPWGKEDHALIDFHKKMIAIHKEYQQLKTGSVKSLDNAAHFISYGRFDKQGAIVVAINNREQSYQTKISVWELGIPMNAVLTRIMLSTEEGFTVEEVPVNVEEGKVSLEMSKTSAIILKYQNNN